MHNYYDGGDDDDDGDDDKVDDGRDSCMTIIKLKV